jgi:hypothetical protein
MKKEPVHYSLPVDTCPRKPRLRHGVDGETLQGTIRRIETRSKRKCIDG